MFIQLNRPCYISIKLDRKEYDKYHEKYTFKLPVLKKDRFQQLHLDNHFRLTKPVKHDTIENTTEEWDHLKRIC